MAHPVWIADLMNPTSIPFADRRSSLIHGTPWWSPPQGTAVRVHACNCFPMTVERDGQMTAAACYMMLSNIKYSPAGYAESLVGIQAYESNDKTTTVFSNLEWLLGANKTQQELLIVAGLIQAIGHRTPKNSAVYLIAFVPDEYVKLGWAKKAGATPEPFRGTTNGIDGVSFMASARMSYMGYCGAYATGLWSPSVVYKIRHLEVKLSIVPIRQPLLVNAREVGSYNEAGTLIVDPASGATAELAATMIPERMVYMGMYTPANRFIITSDEVGAATVVADMMNVISKQIGAIASRESKIETKQALSLFLANGGDAGPNGLFWLTLKQMLAPSEKYIGLDWQATINAVATACQGNKDPKPLVALVSSSFDNLAHRKWPTYNKHGKNPPDITRAYSVLMQVKNLIIKAIMNNGDVQGAIDNFRASMEEHVKAMKAARYNPDTQGISIFSDIMAGNAPLTVAKRPANPVRMIAPDQAGAKRPREEADEPAAQQALPPLVNPGPGPAAQAEDDTAPAVL